MRGYVSGAAALICLTTDESLFAMCARVCSCEFECECAYGCGGCFGYEESGGDEGGEKTFAMHVGH